MALDAGSVYATLGGNFDAKGFALFDRSMHKSSRLMTGFEAAILRSTHRGSRALHTLGTAAGLGAGGGIVALGVAMVGTVKKAADFEAQSDDLRATLKATDAEMRKLERQALRTGISSGLGARKVAEAQTELAKGGLNARQILGGALTATITLARAAKLDLAAAAEITANALNLFQLEGADAAHVADALAQAANSTTADVADFGMALKQSGAAAKAAGLDFDQTMVALEALAKAGVKNSDAGTSLKAALTQLANPTKESANAMGEFGLRFFDAEGRMKSIADISAMLRDRFGNLNNEQRLQLATTLAGTDGMRALLAIYDAGPEKIARWDRELRKQGTAAEVAAEKSDNAAGAGKRLMAAFETGQIILGRAALPILAREAEKLTAALTRAAADGSLEALANDFAQATAGGIQFGVAVGGVMIDVARAGGDVVGVLADIVDAAGGLETVGPALLGAAAGLLAFRAAAAVAPMVLTLARAVGDLMLAFRAGGTAFAASTFVSMINPVTALAAGFAGLGAAIALLATRQSDEERLAAAAASAHREAAAATRDREAAVRSLADAELGAANSAIQAERADRRLKDERARLRQIARDSGTDSKAYRDQLLNVREASVQAAQAHRREGDDLRGLNAERRKASSDKSLKKLREEEIALSIKAGAALIDHGEKSEEFRKANEKLIGVQRQISAEERRIAEDTKRAAVAQVNFQRQLAGLEPISKKGLDAVAGLGKAFDKLPKRVQAQLAIEDEQALSRLGRVAGRLDRYGQTEEVAKILAESGSAEAKIARLQRLLNSLPRQTNLFVNTTFTQRGSRPSLRGGPGAHAGGHKTSGPELAIIGEGAAPEYVIPTEQRHRGRALGLLMAAAEDLGVAGYARGRGRTSAKKRKKDRWKPARRDALSLPLDEIELAESNAKGRYDDARNTLQGLEQDSKAKGKENRDRRKNARAKLGGQRTRTERLKATWKQRQKELRAAKRYAERIKEQEDLIEEARLDMEDADRRDHDKDYKGALKRRRGALGKLQKLIEDARGHVPKDSAYWRELTNRIKGVRNDLGDQPAEGSDVPVDEPAPTDPRELLTPEQQDELDRLEAAIELAEVDTPSDVSDDRARIGDLIGFRQKVLDTLRGEPGAPPALIAEAAREVNAARSRLEGSTSSEPSADLQAQVNQANERARVAADRERIANQALAVLGGPGDIGAGGRNAFEAAAGRRNAFEAAAGRRPQTVINVNTLHPGDSRTLDVIGRAATAGQGGQRTRESKIERTGL